MINMLFVCDSGIAQVMLFVKNALNLIMIISPIIAIISLSIAVGKLVRNPEEKNGLKKLKNMLMALAVIFFIPVFVNVLFYAIGENSAVSDCWNKVDKVSYSTTYIPIDGTEKHSLYTDPNDYQKGVKKKQTLRDITDIEVVSCGSLEYCNKFLTSMVNNSKKLNNAITRNNGKVTYSNSGTPKSWQQAISVAEKGGLLRISCNRPSHWGVKDVTGEYRDFYSLRAGGFKNYSGAITKYTKQLKYDGSMSVKTAIQKGMIHPGDIIGTTGHTFSIYSVNQKDGSAVVFDGGHHYTNKCQKKGKCSTMFTYSSGTTAGQKLYQIIRWVK